MPERYVYETDEGETFVMCQACLLLACDTTGEFQCPRCHQWYLVSHPDEELLIARLVDRETAPLTLDLDPDVARQEP